MEEIAVINLALPPLRGLYVITDAQLIPHNRLIEAVSSALDGGAHWIQYRDKSTDFARRFREASELCTLCHARSAGFIVNDDLELAQACGADGLHIGQDDLPLALARTQLGAHAVIGVSCYNSLELARSAARAGADYLAFGSFFPSSTKPETVRAHPDLLALARTLGKPVCAIGGINMNNAPILIGKGADMIAVISAVFGAPDIKLATRGLATLFERHGTAME